MFKGIFSISLMLLMMLQSLLQLGIIAYYNLNIDEIEALYCVNKDKPDLCCKGKCYISKQLVSSENEYPARQITEDRDFPLFIVANPLSISERIMPETILYAHYCSAIDDGFINEPEYPPIF
ncbi:MAG: hypothetical protein JNM67_03405 [Bacteroidetes bacterium]|nr:hypothetical protein [Bacteroidota bacterium]